LELVEALSKVAYNTLHDQFILDVIPFVSTATTITTTTTTTTAAVFVGSNEVMPSIFFRLHQRLQSKISSVIK